MPPADLGSGCSGADLCILLNASGGQGRRSDRHSPNPCTIFGGDLHMDVWVCSLTFFETSALRTCGPGTARGAREHGTEVLINNHAQTGNQPERSGGSAASYSLLGVIECGYYGLN